MKDFDVIIIGGSYSGLAAAMAMGRAMRKVLIIYSGNPCNKQTPHSHNILTHDGKNPAEIAAIAKQQVLDYNTVTFFDGLAVHGIKTETGFEIQTQGGDLFSGTKLVFASGIKDIFPEIAGFSECWGISMLHCPYCHGYEVRKIPTGILGNGDNGYEFAKLISNWTHDLTLFTNGKSTLTKEQSANLARNYIKIVENRVTKLEQLNGYLQNIIFKDGSKIVLKAAYTSLPFRQNSSIFEQLGGELTENGYIKIDGFQKTSIAGVYACGDNVTRMRTLANAISMGTTTGMTLNKEYIEERF